MVTPRKVPKDKLELLAKTFSSLAEEVVEEDQTRAKTRKAHDQLKLFDDFN